MGDYLQGLEPGKVIGMKIRLATIAGMVKQP